VDNAAFSALTRLLNAGGTNYIVFLRAYSASSVPDESAATVVRRVVGDKAVISETDGVSEGEVVAEVASSLKYAGDAGAGPDPASMQSEEFQQLLAAALAQVSSFASGASTIERFHFKQGHPAYPVFWDFAFLFRHASDCVVLVGSSSD
jgi:hypothetical protein